MPKKLAFEFVVEEVVTIFMKKGEGGEDEKNKETSKKNNISISQQIRVKVKEGGLERPKWLTGQKFGKRVIEVFKYYNDKDMIRKTNASLDKISGEGWMDSKGGGKGYKIAPEG